MEVHTGRLDATGMRVAVVVARFNDVVAQRLLEGAVDALVRHGASQDDITVAWVPGSFEIPLVAQELADTGRFDAVVCLGVVIRGETPHFDYVAREAASGIRQVALATGLPVTFGVITALTEAQALARAGGEVGNRGAEAADAALEMADFTVRMRRDRG